MVDPEVGERRQRYERLRQQALNDRSSFMPVWQTLADFIAPRRPKNLYAMPADSANQASALNDRIIDNHAGAAVDACTAGITSVMTNQARPWFNLQPEDPTLATSKNAKSWLEDSRDRMNATMQRSNLYQMLPLDYEDMEVYGTGALLVEEDPTDVIRTKALPIGTYWVCSNAKGTIDTFGRDYSMTVRQMVEEFGVDAVSEDVRSIYRTGQNLESRRNITHIIVPNSMWDTRKLSGKYKRFASCYYENGGNGSTQDMASMGFLRESGYDQFPVMVSRWKVSGEDQYGDGRGIVALGDIQQLQMEQSKKLKAMDKQLDPPLQVPSALMNQQINMLPGGIVYTDDTSEGKGGIRRLHDVNFDISEVTADIMELHRRIDRAFYADLWLLISQIDRTGVTATEIQAKQDEKLQQLGSPVNRICTELLGPLIERIFAIMLKQGKLLPVPEELQGLNLKIEYESTIALALKIASASGLGRFISVVGNLAQSQPQVVDKVDYDAVVDGLADVMVVPSAMVRSDEEVSAIRAQRANQQAQADRAAQLQQVAKGAELLSKTQLNTNSALNAVLQAQQA